MSIGTKWPHLTGVYKFKWKAICVQGASSTVVFGTKVYSDLLTDFLTQILAFAESCHLRGMGPKSQQIFLSVQAATLILITTLEFWNKLFGFQNIWSRGLVWDHVGPLVSSGLGVSSLTEPDLAVLCYICAGGLIFASVFCLVGGQVFLRDLWDTG